MFWTRKREKHFIEELHARLESVLNVSLKVISGRIDVRMEMIHQQLEAHCLTMEREIAELTKQLKRH